MCSDISSSVEYIGTTDSVVANSVCGMLTRAGRLL